MSARCKICDGEINPRDGMYCRYCKTPYHIGCIKSHLYNDKSCPSCGRTTSIAHYRRGLPEAVTSGQAGPEGDHGAPGKRSASYADSGDRKTEGAPAAKREKTSIRGGKVLFLANIIIISLLLASANYVHTTYVDYGPELSADGYSTAVIPGQSAEFTLTLQNPGNLISRYTVYVDVSSVTLPSGWQITLLDDETAYEGNSIEVLLAPSEKYQFKARVSTTSGAEGNSEGSFKIVASSRDGRYSGSEIFSVATETTYSYELHQGDSQKYVSAGGTAQFSAEIENLGDDTDTYYIGIEGVTSGWGASLAQEQVTVEANGSGGVTLTMTAPQDAGGNEEGEIFLSVSSQHHQEDVKTLKYTLVVNPDYAFDVTSGELSKEVVPGTSAAFTFKLRNLGNTADDYTLSPAASLPSGWSFTLTKDAVSLESEGQMTIGLSIMVPEDAAGNLKGVVSVIMSSNGNGQTETITFSVTTVKEQEKFILVELFTSLNCGFCPAAEAAIEDILADYPGKIIVLEHHLNDSLATSFSSERGSKYMISGYPVAVFDGVKKESGGTSTTYSEYVSIVEQLIDDEPLVRIYPTVSDSTTNPGMSVVSALIKSEGLGRNTPLDVLFVTYRNDVSPQGYSSKIYDYVSVDAFETTIESLDSIKTITFTLDIPEDGGVVIFVQDSDTDKVYQCVVIEGDSL